VFISIDLHSLFLVTHPPEPLIDPLVLPFTESPSFIILEKLFSDGSLGVFLSQSLSSHIILISYNRTNLEVLGQLLGVVALIETIWVDKISQLESS
jgi:hypothetical protein